MVGGGSGAGSGQSLRGSKGSMRTGQVIKVCTSVSQKKGGGEELSISENWKGPLETLQR